MRSALACLNWFTIVGFTTAFSTSCGSNLGAANGAGTGGVGSATGGVGSGTGGMTGSVSECSSNQDCPASNVCGYEADLSCSIGAHCIPSKFCNDVTAECGCDGRIVLVGCGVASRAFKGAGACADGTGGTPSTTRVVSLTELAGKEVLPCAAGYAHPNICCQGAPYSATTCAEDLTHPFDICKPEQLAYPDPNACCSLDNRTSCVQPSVANVTTDAGQASNCQNPCSIGAYPPPPFFKGDLCVFGTGMSIEPVEPWCSLCTGPVQWCNTPCPVGWSTPALGQVDLCCQTDSSGRNFCFSQAGYVGVNGGGGGGYSDTAGCRDEQFVGDGNSYVVACDFVGSGTCNCFVNGVVVRTFSSAEVQTADQSDPTQVNTTALVPCGISQCGFPPL